MIDTWLVRPRLHHKRFDEGSIKPGRLGWRESGRDQDDGTIDALDSVLTKCPKLSKQPSFQIEKVVCLFPENRVVERLESPGQIQDRFGGRVGRIVEVVSDAVQDCFPQRRIAEQAKMKREDLGGFGTQVNL